MSLLQDRAMVCIEVECELRSGVYHNFDWYHSRPRAPLEPRHTGTAKIGVELRGA